MPNGGMPVFTLIATGWRYRKIFFYKKALVKSRSSVEMAEQIKQYFWRRCFRRPILHCVIRKFMYLWKLRAYSHWNFVSDSGLRVRHGTSVIATCCHISWTKVDAQCGKLATALSWQYLRRSTSDRWHRAWHAPVCICTAGARVARVRRRQLILITHHATTSAPRTICIACVLS